MRFTLVASDYVAGVLLPAAYGVLGILVMLARVILQLKLSK